MAPDLRSRLLLTVERFPGLHLRELQRRCECSPMLAEYHLNVLEKLELIHSSPQGRYRHFFPARQAASTLDRTDRTWLSLLRRPPLLAIALLLLERGPMRAMEIAQELALASSTASYQLRVAQEGGLTALHAPEGRPVVQLADPVRVLALLQAHHPTPDLMTEYAGLWSAVFRKTPAAVAPEPLPAAEGMPNAVTALPRAAQMVFLALRPAPLTQKELCLETGHARRTVYSALKKLDAAGVLTSHVHLLDTRQTRYWLKDELRDKAPKANQ